jgi:hypothetical protein
MQRDEVEFKVLSGVPPKTFGIQTARRLDQVRAKNLLLIAELQLAMCLSISSADMLLSFQYVVKNHS